MNDSTQVVQKNKKWLVPMIIGAVISVILIVAVAIIVSMQIAAAPKRALQKQLDLGDKYLSDMDYDNAILAYEEAIELDPKDERAYLKLADVYEILADAELSEHKNDEAVAYLDKGINVLNKGIAETSSDNIRNRKKELEGKKKKISDGEEEETKGEENGGVSSEELIEGKLKEISFLDTEGGEFVDYIAGGVVIVGKYDDSGVVVYGAKNYDGKVIAPIKYQAYKNPTENGYFVMIEGHMDKWDSLDYDKFVLYSSKGEIVYEGVNNVVASKEAYIISKQEKGDEQEDWAGAGTRFEYKDEYSIEYYNWDSKLLVSVDNCKGWEGFMAEPAGFVNGKSVVICNKKGYYTKDAIVAFENYDIGYVSSDGTIEWTDGDGIDVSKTDCIPYEEAERVFQEKQKQVIGSGGVLEGADNGLRPKNYYVDGIMTGITLGGVTPIHYVLRDEAGNSCELDPWHIVLNPDGTMQYKTRKETKYGKTVLYIENSYDVDGDIDYISYPDNQNGSFIANYGSKMQMHTKDDRWLLADISVKNGTVTCKVFDYLSMSLEKYWLISKNGKWGYCDHNGNEVKMFDDAAAFRNGFAVIIENETAYLVNEEFEKVEMIGAAESSFQCGQGFGIRKDDVCRYFILE